MESKHDKQCEWEGESSRGEAEGICSLSPSGTASLTPTSLVLAQILESFRTFGLSESTKHLLVIHVAQTPSSGGPSSTDVLTYLKSTIVGHFDERGPRLTLDLSSTNTDAVTDWPAVVKVYKLQDIDLEDDVGPTKSSSDRSALEKQTRSRKRIDALVTSCVASKFVAS